jgi:hypothetical protein
MMTGVMAPVMLMSLAMGVEVAWWSTVKVELQRTADIAAWAGAMSYARSSDAQRATGVAANLAELNGAAGSASRTWDAASNTLTDGLITAQVVAGIRDPNESAVKVIVKQDLATSFSKIFPGVGSLVTISAAAVAEIGVIDPGPQPCMTALGQGVDGITTESDATFSGNVDLTAVGCALRSNTGITKNGNGIVQADGIYAGGSISSGVCCDLHAHSGQIYDPYANYAPLNDAFALLSGSSGTAVGVKSGDVATIDYGAFASWDIQGTLNLNPGRYIVNGPISIGARGKISGTGVMIITSGAVTVNGGSTLLLTAATTANAANNAIPGIVIAGTSHDSMSLSGNTDTRITGVVYFPQATLKFSGTSSASSGDGCLQILASTINLVGTTNLATNCSEYGTLKYGSLPEQKTIALVQ